MRKVLSHSLLGSLGAVSGSTIYRSTWQPIDSFDHYMVQVVWTGTPTAQVSLLVSADPVSSGYVAQDVAAPKNYDIQQSSTVNTTTVPLSPSGQYIITYDVTVTSGNWAAVQWVNGSGSGTITAINFVGKGAQV